MSRRVSISLKTARALFDLALNRWSGSDVDLGRTLEELEAAMKPKRSLAPARQRRTAKRETVKERRAEIRTQLEARANGSCEACGISERFVGPLEWDHFFGRVRVPETVRSGWLLCPECHRQKTENRPYAETWLEAFADHCRRHGYASERRMASDRLDARALSRESAERGEP